MDFKGNLDQEITFETSYHEINLKTGSENPFWYGLIFRFYSAGQDY